MAITVGRNADGNAFITGNNNQTFVFYGLKEIPPELVDDIQSGRKIAADVPEAVPLPALTLSIRFKDDTRMEWEIAAGRATGDPVARDIAAPWRDDPAFEDALDNFWRLSRVPVEKPEDGARLNAAAQRIGDALALALSAEEAAFLTAASRGDPPPPLLVTESDDDRILALPWELIRLEGQFAVRDGRLDVARSVPNPIGAVLSKPAAPMSLLVNISAPIGSGLDYDERATRSFVRSTKTSASWSTRWARSTTSSQAFSAPRRLLGCISPGMAAQEHWFSRTSTAPQNRSEFATCSRKFAALPRIDCRAFSFWPAVTAETRSCRRPTTKACRQPRPLCTAMGSRKSSDISGRYSMISRR
jgi:hypothetical protein